VLASVEDSSLSPLPQRLARRLLALREAVGDDALPVTQQRLGELLGVTRENVARVLARWGRAGLVRNLHGRLLVSDVEALRRMSSG
jgi:CRP-like cAMP-binding protein